jgi:hypothetical protein
MKIMGTGVEFVNSWNTRFWASILLAMTYLAVLNVYQNGHCSSLLHIWTTVPLLQRNNTKKKT